MAAVLIVEDEEKIARFIELELKHEGYEVGKAVDGRSGAFGQTAGHVLPDNGGTAKRNGASKKAQEVKQYACHHGDGEGCGHG